MLPIGLPESIAIYLKGLVMGMADIIPGVSGGTMALITGIYERLIHAIRAVNFRFVPLFLRRDIEGAKANLRSIDYPLFVPLLLGIFSAILILARVITYLLEHQIGPIYGFFFGLILASAGFVYHYVERIDAKHLVSGLAGFVIVFLVVGMQEVMTNHSLPVIFVVGGVAICAMILPGISGSLILLILGQYNHMLDALTKGSYKDLVVFASGALVGILLFARLLDHMLKNHRSMTMVFLFGCMLGALRLPAEMIGGSVDLASVPSVAMVLASAVVGFLIVVALERRSMALKGMPGTGPEGG